MHLEIKTDDSDFISNFKLHMALHIDILTPGKLFFHFLGGWVGDIWYPTSSSISMVDIFDLVICNIQWHLINGRKINWNWVKIKIQRIPFVADEIKKKKKLWTKEKLKKIKNYSFFFLSIWLPLLLHVIFN